VPACALHANHYTVGGFSMTHQSKTLNSRKSKQVPKKQRLSASTIARRYFELQRLREMVRTEISQRALRV
jgi:hypothetical protein